MIIKSKPRALAVSRLTQNEQGALTTQAKVKKTKKVPLNDFPFLVTQTLGLIEISLPVKTVSEANNFDNWRVKQKRHSNQKWWVSLAMSKVECQIPCVVKLVRYAPGFLDEEDNLRMALKWIKDYVAAEITQDFRPGRADGNKLIKWEYDQIKSKSYGAKIFIEPPFQG